MTGSLSRPTTGSPLGVMLSAGVLAAVGVVGGTFAGNAVAEAFGEETFWDKVAALAGAAVGLWAALLVGRAVVSGAWRKAVFVGVGAVVRPLPLGTAVAFALSRDREAAWTFGAVLFGFLLTTGWLVTRRAKG